MTTIIINQDLENFESRTYNSYQELMEDLAEYHGYKILWQVKENEIPSDVREALEKYRKNPPKELFNI